MVAACKAARDVAADKEIVAENKAILVQRVVADVVLLPVVPLEHDMKVLGIIYVAIREVRVEAVELDACAVRSLRIGEPCQMEELAARRAPVVARADLGPRQRASAVGAVLRAFDMVVER